IDKYNEAGEKITDEIKEYSKRLENDTCPYNFLYNGESEPFLHPSQNISEYWSRTSYVIAAILGIFVILKVGQSHITDQYKKFIKNTKKRLDFSLNIYSPKLDFTKHIKRRVWQETWSALILTSDQLKVPSGKVIAYSQSPHRPPYLLNFSGSVAERHVENLKIMKHIGLKHYTTSLAPLPISLEKLRIKIVNNFVGPDMYYSPEFLNSKIKTYFGKAYVVPFPFSLVMCYDDDD
ncbi:7714_t:CDS:2, partial [Racocetra persica]